MTERRSPQYELGTLVFGTWTQWMDSIGQEYYVEASTGASQYGIPAGWEDNSSDIWTVDRSKPWPQWRNQRTGRIRTAAFDAASARTYLEDPTVLTALRLVERSPESEEYLYRRVMVEVLRFSFSSSEGFTLYQEESRGMRMYGGTVPDMVVFKILARPGGSMYTYDYCMVESKRPGRNWHEAEDHLSRHCEGTDNPSKLVYAILQIGLLVKFYTADNGELTALSGRLHLRDHIDEVTAMFARLKRNPLRIQ